MYKSLMKAMRSFCRALKANTGGETNLVDSERAFSVVASFLAGARVYLYAHGWFEVFAAVPVG